ncbi:hypothetical protein [Streptomyces sp. NPDC020983]|uniref:hypothetical protein n=1 Tax=Streptomyces sp. NPDC020983 TaxID=3365106 RepID=UPI0037BDB8FF
MPKYTFTITGHGPSNGGKREELVGSGTVTAPTREAAEAAVRADHEARGHTIDRLNIYG